jgi:hypothetical protein
MLHHLLLIRPELDVFELDGIAGVGATAKVWSAAPPLGALPVAEVKTKP